MAGRCVLYAIAYIAFGGILAAIEPLEASGPSLNDTSEGFFQYLEQVRRASPSEADVLWRDLYYSPHSDLLKQLSCADLSPNGMATEIVRQWLDLQPDMENVAARIREELPMVEDRFTAALPYFRWSGDVHLVASAFCFDGLANDISGKPAVLLGLDTLAKSRNSQTDVLLTHELFHIYHADYFRPARSAIWTRLWQEGLATFASRQINPDADYSAIMLDERMVTAARADFARLRTDLAIRLDESGLPSENLYFRTGPRDEPVPPRAGYYIGYCVVVGLAEQGTNLAEMAHWDAQTVRSTILNALLRTEPC